MMGLFDGLNSQFVWQMASILYLYTIIIDSDANRTTCIMEHPMMEKPRAFDPRGQATVTPRGKI